MLTLTPITWIARCGDCHFSYGDPYEGVATVQGFGDYAHVSAASKLPLKDQIHLCDLLKELGFKWVVFERYKNGIKKEYRRKLLKEVDK